MVVVLTSRQVTRQLSVEMRHLVPRLVILRLEGLAARQGKNEEKLLFIPSSFEVFAEMPVLVPDNMRTGGNIDIHIL